MISKLLCLVLVSCISTLAIPVNPNSESIIESPTDQKNTSDDIETSLTTANIKDEENFLNGDIDDEDDSQMAIRIMRETIEEIINKINDAISNDEFASIVDELNTIVDIAFSDKNLDSKKK